MVHIKLPLYFIGFFKLLICTANTPAILIVIWQAEILIEKLVIVDEEVVAVTEVLVDKIISIGNWRIIFLDMLEFIFGTFYERVIEVGEEKVELLLVIATDWLLTARKRVMLPIPIE